MSKFSSDTDLKKAWNVCVMGGVSELLTSQGSCKQILRNAISATSERVKAMKKKRIKEIQIAKPLFERLRAVGRRQAKINIA